MKARDVEKKLKADGWLVLPGKKTSHKHFIHPECPEKGKVTVPFHAGDVNALTLKNIAKQSGVDLG